MPLIWKMLWTLSGSSNSWRIDARLNAITNASGVAKCNIGKARSYQRYRYITMRFAGDRHGPRYDYAVGEARVKVLMKR